MSAPTAVTTSLPACKLSNVSPRLQCFDRRQRDRNLNAARESTLPATPQEANRAHHKRVMSDWANGNLLNVAQALPVDEVSVVRSATQEQLARISKLTHEITYKPRRAQRTSSQPHGVSIGADPIKLCPKPIKVIHPGM